MQGNFALALALFFVLEGILPFAAPGLWRQTFIRIANLTDGQVRFFGLISMASGLSLMFLFKL